MYTDLEVKICRLHPQPELHISHDANVSHYNFLPLSRLDVKIPDFLGATVTTVSSGRLRRMILKPIKPE